MDASNNLRIIINRFIEVLFNKGRNIIMDMVFFFFFFFNELFMYHFIDGVSKFSITEMSSGQRCDSTFLSNMAIVLFIYLLAVNLSD